ncbi:hypothetical protein HAX54_028041 [Datura stramonium]|uniref:Protein kinase domain-containing protein n=1 Tax=Datura stramonium TaxID=4076 RepID=A0ABS8S984_DATST|nr:hypothetical protein [Datura stramonium]
MDCSPIGTESAPNAPCSWAAMPVITISTLQKLNLGDNSFGDSIFFQLLVPVLARLPNLQRSRCLANNLLNGSIPEFLSNLTELTRLVIAQNPFKPSTLPSSIGRLGKLQVLYARSANLIGNIPDSIKDLKSILNFDVAINNLSGKIPESIGELKSIQQIELFANHFSGELPDKFQSWFSVQFKLFNNRFSGTLPKKFGVTSNLDEFDVSGNNLEGSLPPNLCSRKKLRILNLFDNKFTGSIQNPIECNSLTYVRIYNNQFSGELPTGFWGFAGCTFLELRNNIFQGSILQSQCSSLKCNFSSPATNSRELPAEMPFERACDVVISKNQLSGAAFVYHKIESVTEKAIFQKIGSRAKFPNQLVPGQTTELNLANNQLTGEIPVELGTLPVLNYLDLSEADFWRNSFGAEQAQAQQIQLRILNLCPECPKTQGAAKSTAHPPSKRKSVWRYCIQSAGLQGDVLAALTDDNLIGAGGSGREVFRSEVETSGRVRHGNIVKLLYSGIGGDFRILVYEYVENGSLGDVLHGEKVHRDVKSNNILLDEDFRPKVADFGLAKAMQRDTEEVIKPCPMLRVPTGTLHLGHCQVGVRVCNFVYERRRNWPCWYQSGILDLNQLVDQRMSPSASDYTEIKNVFDVALLCTSALPINRPSMRRVVELLKDRPFTRSKSIDALQFQHVLA